MSIFANLFQGAKTASTTLFSEGSQYRSDESAQAQASSAAVPGKKRKKRRHKSHADQPTQGDAHTEPQPREAVSPSQSRVFDTMDAQPAALHNAKSGAFLDKRNGECAEQAGADAHAGNDSDDSIAPHEKANPPASVKGSTVQDEEATKRTVFVGNIPADTKKSALRKLFSTYGSIESVRLRSLPIDNDSRMPRNLQIKAGKVNTSGGPANAYICFRTEEEAAAACAENMSVFMDQHIRVDMAGSRSGQSVEAHYPPARSVFVGNLALDIKEEDLISIFNTAEQAPQLEHSVEAVRIVRDSKTRIGKGIAYVLFKSRVAALAALQLNESECKGRKMRVSRVEKLRAKVSVGAGPRRSKKHLAAQHRDQKSHEFLGQKHSKAGMKKKGKSLATAQPNEAGNTNTPHLGRSSRAIKRPAVAARKAKALLAAGKVPPASALAALEKKKKQKKQRRMSVSND